MYRTTTHTFQDYIKSASNNVLLKLQKQIYTELKKRFDITRTKTKENNLCQK